MKPCPEQLTRLSALVDGALNGQERERVQAHLVHCGGCRTELAELRSLRGLLSGAATPAESAESASSDLSARLVRIAGENAADPLWTRTFHRSGTGQRPRLPHSRRRVRRRRVRVASASLAGAAVMAVAIGWVAAPPTRTAAVDPAAGARAEFANALNEVPLGNQAVAAATMADQPSAQTEQVESPGLSGSDSWPEAQGRDLLRRATTADQAITLQGTQEVQVRHRAGYWVTKVAVRSQAGQGLELQVNPDRQSTPGRGSASRFVGVADPVPADLASGYDLSAGQESVVAGRPATVVTARDQGRPAARWWIDRAQGFLLWQETYGSDGEIIQSAGYSAITVTDGQPAAFGHFAPRLAMGQNAASLSLSRAPQLDSGGWARADSLAGMALVQLHADSTDAPGRVQSVYSDGVRTVSLVEQRGALDGPPSGFVWDPELGAYRNVGMTTMLTWQSSDRVFTVATDGGPEVARQAMAELPRQDPVLRTDGDRVLQGWRHVARMVLGQ